MRFLLPSPFPINGSDERSNPEHNVTPNTSIHPNMGAKVNPSVLIIASCNTLCMPKKKKTHNARHMNWIDFGSTSSLSDNIDPILLVLPEPVMLAITMAVRLGHLEGVVGQSSCCAILLFFATRTCQLFALQTCPFYLTTPPTLLQHCTNVTRRPALLARTISTSKDYQAGYCSSPRPT